MNILAIDPSTHLGYYNSNGEYGKIELKKEYKGRFLGLHDDIEHLIDTASVVAIERPAGQFKNSLILLGKICGVIEFMAEKRGLSVVYYSAKQIKLFATGSGAASKDAMKKEANKHINCGEDDDIADAYWLHQLAQSVLTEKLN
jgi:Holliday junction resolvasome RuvABC endonuclease subunit